MPIEDNKKVVRRFFEEVWNRTMYLHLTKFGLRNIRIPLVQIWAVLGRMKRGP